VWLKESSGSAEKKDISFLTLNQLEKISNINKKKNNSSISYNQFGNKNSNFSTMSLDPTSTSSSTSSSIPPSSCTTTATTTTATSFSTFSTSLSEQLKACSGPPPPLSLPCSERAIEMSWRECFSYQW
jgi:hypothetical protein